MTKHDKNLRILDAVYHEVALVEADEGTVTPELRRDVDAIMAYTRERLAELRRAELRRQAAPRIEAAPVRASILVMTREAIVARLRVLWSVQGGAILAHRDFAGMADDDLRSALEDAEALTEPKA
jgi:hypothetical protein